MNGVVAVADEPTGKSPAPKRVLVVDDDESVLLSLPAVLASPRVSVATASTLAEAEAFLDERPVDLVITDLRLRSRADTDGLELLSWVGEHHPETGVVLITGYGSAEIRDEALRRGARAYWEKSLSMEELVRQLRLLGIPVGTGA